MEKRILGFILTLLGIAGLIAAGYYFMNASQGTHNIKLIILYAVLGVIFFVSDISLIKNTADKAT